MPGRAGCPPLHFACSCLHLLLVGVGAGDDLSRLVDASLAGPHAEDGDREADDAADDGADDHRNDPGADDETEQPADDTTDDEERHGEAEREVGLPLQRRDVLLEGGDAVFDLGHTLVGRVEASFQGVHAAGEAVEHAGDRPVVVESEEALDPQGETVVVLLELVESLTELRGRVHEGEAALEVLEERVDLHRGGREPAGGAAGEAFEPEFVGLAVSRDLPQDGFHLVGPGLVLDDGGQLVEPLLQPVVGRFECRELLEVVVVPLQALVELLVGDDVHVGHRWPPFL